MKHLLILLTAMLLYPSTTMAEDNWNFRLTPYAWLAGVEGDVSTVPGSPVIPIEVTPSDALSDSEAAYMVFFEAKKQRHGMLFDVLYTDIQSDLTLVEEIGLNMQSVSRNKVYSAAYLFETYNQDQSVVDFIAGVRYWNVDTILKLSGGLGILAGQRISNEESWLDPLIGFKGRTKLGNSNFFAAGWLIGGGLGIGSDGFFDVSANLGYQWNESIGTTLGYRYFSVNYEDGSFVYDVNQEGLILGLTWAF